ncbi:hypothetical protein P171DRAFT_520651 [Karstenula rhodostoma CBS 690.94]|uniref:Homeobox domain-containing protein n=1 Tax=Karstenula rhodostoma CBS 690.94 TaxID=1392251 RepID=A0A9P4UDZ9_9PLEO|nr:hypothetical protein P171DRAFT_520651 [Karstenula rhodostoma CBS 690.94]
MNAAKLEVDEDTWALLELDNGNLPATEQIDWSSFVNLEYDPSIPFAPTGCSPAVEELAPPKASDGPQIPSPSHIPPSIENGSEFAMLDFPSMEEWWAELPDEVRSGDWVSPTETATLSGYTPNSDSNYSAYADERSPNLQDEGNDGKRRRRMPPEARRLLTGCFERHREDPYVPKEEIQQLVSDTGLSIRQIQIFFANSRARKLPHPAPEGKGVDIPTPADQQGPMERFFSSSPEDEGISEDAVRAAAGKADRPIKPARSRKGKASSVRSSSQSSTSNSSAASMDSLDSRGSRKGRKRQREPSHNVAKTIFRKPSSPSRKYQCTFCTTDFEQKYDWKRHEESVHFPQKEWVCMPNGPVEDSKCVFCDLNNVDEEHLTSHKSIACSEAPRELRTFQRKDKLVQHIKQVHGCPPPKAIKNWCKLIERKVLLLCGFCSLALSDWKTRADHISTHFTAGVEMTLWLPELLGGIWPDDALTQNFIKDKFSATAHPAGPVPCDACPARFPNLRNLTLHRRQVHAIYHPTDSKVVMAKPGAGHHSQRLISLAQQTSRIQVARLDGPAGGAAPPDIVPPGAPLERADYKAVFSKGTAPAATRPPINRPLNAPEHRGFASAPHPAWKPVLNNCAVAGPRAVPNPLTHHPTRGPASVPSTLRPSNLGRTALSHAEAVSQAATSQGLGGRRDGPPVDAIRSILTQNREGVGGVGVPAQGMLHSLEQFGTEGEAWPRPRPRPRPA